MRGMVLGGLILALFVVAGSFVDGGDKKNPGTAELKKLQGTWKFLSQEFEGKARPAEDVAKLKITFTGDKWSVTEDGKEVQAGTHTLDPSKKPAQLDAKITEGHDKGNTMIGIYEMKGDTLTVIFDLKGKDRPTEFKSKAGQMLAVIQKLKK